MLIERGAWINALRQEGNVYRKRCVDQRPPSGGACKSWRIAITTDMALLTEGANISLGVYKHYPPDGGTYLFNFSSWHGPLIFRHFVTIGNDARG